MTPNAHVMYLRPGNLFKEFLIEGNDETIGESGRPEISYQEETRTLKGCLADATEGDKERWKQLQHPITHTIVQNGKAQYSAYLRGVLRVGGCDMPLVKIEERPIFDTAQISRGDLLYARRRSWTESLGGIVTGVREDTLTVQYHPRIGNVTNHFHISYSRDRGG